MRCVECGSLMHESREPIVEVVRGVEVSVNGISHYQCDRCGNKTMTAQAAEQLGRRQFEEVARKKGLLSPAQIKEIRIKLGLTQKEFEELIGVTSPTVSRWETGVMLPSKTTDTLIRVLAEFPEAVSFLQKKLPRSSFVIDFPGRNAKRPSENWSEGRVPSEGRGIAA